MLVIVMIVSVPVPVVMFIVVMFIAVVVSILSSAMNFPGIAIPRQIPPWPLSRFGVHPDIIPILIIIAALRIDLIVTDLHRHWKCRYNDKVFSPGAAPETYCASHQ